MIVASAVMLFLVTSLIASRLIAEAKLAVVRVRLTGRVPELPALPTECYHLFLSHTWCSAQDQVTPSHASIPPTTPTAPLLCASSQVALIKRRVVALLPAIQIFLDIDNLVDQGSLAELVGASNVLLSFLSRHYFRSRASLRELRAAIAQRKPLVRVWEADLAKGGQPLDELLTGCHPWLVDYIFPQGTATDVLRWHRLPHFQLVTLRLIIGQMLQGISRAPQPLELFVPNELTRRRLRLPSGAAPLVYASSANHGAAELAAELAKAMAGLAITSEPLPRARARRASQLVRPRVPTPFDMPPVQTRVRHPTTELPTCSMATELARLQGLECTSPGAVDRKRTVDFGGDVLGPPSSPSRRLRTGDRQSGVSERTSLGRQSGNMGERVSLGRQSAGEGAAPRSRLRSASAPPRPLLRARVEGEGGLRPTHMLLVLSSRTFTGELGEQLADDVRTARAAGPPRNSNHPVGRVGASDVDTGAAGVCVVLAHETDRAKDGCEFDEVIAGTPGDLLAGGIYSRIAVPLFSRAEFRAVCVALLKLEFGAHETRAASRRHLAQPLSDSFSSSFKAAVERSASKKRQLGELGRSSAALLRRRSSALLLGRTSSPRCSPWTHGPRSQGSDGGSGPLTPHSLSSFRMSPSRLASMPWLLGGELSSQNLSDADGSCKKRPTFICTDRHSLPPGRTTASGDGRISAVERWMGRGRRRLLPGPFDPSVRDSAAVLGNGSAKQSTAV